MGRELLSGHLNDNEGPSRWRCRIPGGASAKLVLRRVEAQQCLEQNAGQGGWSQGSHTWRSGQWGLWQARAGAQGSWVLAGFCSKYSGTLLEDQAGVAIWLNLYCFGCFIQSGQFRGHFTQHSEEDWTPITHIHNLLIKIPFLGWFPLFSTIPIS